MDMHKRFLVLLAALVVFAVACGDDSPISVGGEGSTTTSQPPPTAAPDQPEAQLATARARWDDTGPDDYRMTLTELCFCPETVWIETVVGGVVTSHEPGSDESFYDPGPRSMVDLFDEVQDIIDAGYAILELEFDPDTGALVRYWVDIEESMADEEHGVVVELGAAATAGIDASSLADDYGCGYAFALGSAEQDLALVVVYAGGRSPELDPITFPSPRWEGELWIGSDLFSNWCNDDIDVSDPVPVITETWTLTAGTMTIEPTDADVECGPEPIRATVTGAVATSPSGEALELGEVEFVNTAFGCFAG